LKISIYFCDILIKYTMKTLSLKLDDNIYDETEDMLTKIKKSRNRYINEAVDYYNRINRRNLIARKLAKESRLVKKESLAVLSEFESLQDEN
jgi:predicted transcriptional regulator